eukprot:1182422-Prorocentrum_minimum.AAC.4
MRILYAPASELGDLGDIAPRAAYLGEHADGGEPDAPRGGVHQHRVFPVRARKPRCRAGEHRLAREELHGEAHGGRRRRAREPPRRRLRRGQVYVAHDPRAQAPGGQPEHAMTESGPPSQQDAGAVGARRTGVPGIRPEHVEHIAEVERHGEHLQLRGGRGSGSGSGGRGSGGEGQRRRGCGVGGGGGRPADRAELVEGTPRGGDQAERVRKPGGGGFPGDDFLREGGPGPQRHSRRVKRARSARVLRCRGATEPCGWRQDFQF